MIYATSISSRLSSVNYFLSMVDVHVVLRDAPNKRERGKRKRKEKEEREIGKRKGREKRERGRGKKRN